MRVLLASGLVLLSALGFVACGGGGGAPDPFPTGEGGAAGAAGGAGGAGGAENEGGFGPIFGEPCVDDPQCDDGLDCTFDACDLERGRCRYVTDDTACSDGVYCNGVEVCDAALGCRPSGVMTCSDQDTCTIDTCIEETQSCRHDPRDGDGDGDPVWNCMQGADCDDADPLISSEASERCGNSRDDDCDGEVDEDDCSSPHYDTCSEALEIDAPGNYELTFRAASDDYALSCATREEGAPAFRDLVLALIVPAGPPLDVDVSAVTGSGKLALAARERCGTAAGELQCEAGFEHGQNGSSARLILREAEAGAHPVYLAGTVETDVYVQVDFRETEGPPTNETCGSALTMPVDEPVSVTLASVERDVNSACAPATGDVLYRFALEAESDVRITAFTLDDLGIPVISLRDAGCSDAADEITCRAWSPSELYARSLPSGEYYVAVAGTGPSDVELSLSIEAPSEKPIDEGCGSTEPLGNAERLVSLLDHTDAVQTTCLAGVPDATYALELEARSDVALIARGPDDDRGAVSLFEEACAESERLACSAGGFPLRAVAHGVGPGEFRAVVETVFGVEASLRAFTRPATATTLVHRSDECADAVLIPETGGRFEGNTQNAFADYEASCDFGGQPEFGAPEQMLRLALSERKRVVFDLAGSDYDTLLVVREASECPGAEVTNTCVPGFVSGRSFLETSLEPGEYWIQIDGFNGESGRWSLEVFVASP